MKEDVGRIADARAAVLTAKGRGAIAVVRVWGEAAVRVADAVFRPARGGPLHATPRGRLRLGRIGAGLGDEVVVVVTEDAPPEVEIQCHGGPAAVALVFDALRASGVEVADARGWIGRAGPARVTAEAAIDLPRAATVRAAGILLDQADGALERELCRAADFIESDPGAALQGLDDLIRRAEWGVRLVPGWRVVLAGRPNVGKSRLFNALAGYERAIVDATPGTTRDVVTVQTAIAGWPVELADTAGLRAPGDPIEAAGVALARSRHAGADLVLLVLDCSEPLRTEDHELMTAFPDALRVASKADLPPAWPEEPCAALAVSAASGAGLAALVAAIGRRLAPRSVPPGVGVPFRVDHLRALRRSRLLLAGDRPAAARRAVLRLLAASRDGRSG